LTIDLLLLIGVGAAVVAAAGAIGLRIERKRVADHRRQGMKNAEEERLRQEEICVECQLPVDPSVDLFDKGSWWHRKCWRDVVG
jgi:hypothetical protein